MKTFLILGISLLASAACSQPATFRDGTLLIPEAAVTDTQNPDYYTDVQLTVDGDGRLRIVAAVETNLVTIEEVSIALMESFPVQVTANIKGYKSTPCVKLLTPAVDRKDNLFTVVVAETVLGPAESCIAVTDPFALNVSLDVLGLSAGTYTANVNGVSAQFTLTVDNLPQ